ncbi:hypothetical protein [Paenibacillus antibioticophila]|uniref:hypothetical protein n=1 Tax=Paenibacillus antibioticophila TaxID=1274374 RepID=UPI001BB40E0E|nr:hypothetical protein [Paenibacillus antibioticophila]
MDRYGRSGLDSGANFGSAAPSGCSQSAAPPSLSGRFCVLFSVMVIIAVLIT